MLDPQARALIDLMVERGVPPVYQLTPAEARRMYRERRGFTQPEPPSVASVQDMLVPGPGNNGANVPCRLYKPLHASAPLPVLVYFHGGGWTIGDLDTHDVLCRQLCAGAACALLAVDYRLGPEHRFPAAPEDCFAATRWLQQHAGAHGLDATRLALGGDSAGGNLAAVVALMLRDAGASLAAAAPCLQLLIYPATDMRAVAPSHTSNGQGYMLTADSVAYYRRHYIEHAASWSDWRASPLLAADLTRLPPALVLTAGFDPLRDEGLQYANALSAAGNRTQYICFERQIHGFITMSRVIDEALSAVDLCACALRRAFSQAGA
jgi:acetyl esterase